MAILICGSLVLIQATPGTPSADTPKPRPRGLGRWWALPPRRRWCGPPSGTGGSPGRRAHRALGFLYMRAQLLARIYGVFALQCSRCGGRVHPAGFITEPAPVRQILEHVGERTTTPAIAPAR